MLLNDQKNAYKYALECFKTMPGNQKASCMLALCYAYSKDEKNKSKVMPILVYLFK